MITMEIKTPKPESLWNPDPHSIWRMNVPKVNQLRLEELSDQIKNLDHLDAARLLRDLIEDMRNPRQVGRQIGRSLLVVSRPDYRSSYRPGARERISRGECNDLHACLEEFVEGVGSA